MILLAFLLALLFVYGQERAEIFRLIQPTLDSPDGAQWRNSMMRSWWAGEAHDAGHLFYLLVAWFGVYLALAQNVAGWHTAMVIAALPSVSYLKIDWSNSDGSYGWMAMKDAYRTVVWSLLLHGVAISLLVVIVGFRNVGYVAPIVVLYGAAFFLYVLLPLWAFESVYPRARDAAIAALRAERRTDDSRDSLLAELNFADKYVAKFSAIRAARVSPLLGRLDLELLLVAFFVPLLLTIIQVLPAVVQS